MMGTIVGIDPGNSGAIAILDPERARMRIVDMPTFEFVTTKVRIKSDPFTIAEELKAQPIADLYIEDVAASPQMGTVSAFSFGEGKGILLGVTAAMCVPTTLVKPNQWKKQMRVPSDKRATVQRACQLFPSMVKLFKGPKGGLLDGRAEAALIALYAAMELGRAPTAPVQIWEDFNAESYG